jgi:multidrug efflux system outer membrane protein
MERRLPSRGLASLGLVSLLLSGCVSLDPAYHRPTDLIAPTWPTGAAYAPAKPALSTIATVGWRDFFADPKLKAVIALALAHNPDLRVAVANVAAARAEYTVQRASLFPTVDAGGNGTAARIPLSTLGAETGGAPITGASKPYYYERQYSANVGISAYEIDLFGRVQSLSRSAQEQYFANEDAQRAAQILLVSQVATDYLTLGSDRALLKVSEDTAKSGQGYLDLTQKQFEAGVASQLQVRQAETTLEQAKADIARYTTAVAQDRNALELVVGAPVDDALLPDDLQDQVTLLSDLPAGLNSDVLFSRPDVLEAEHNLKAQNGQIGAARAAFFPSISLTGSGGVSSDALSQLFTGASKAWSFEPSLSIPIFTGGQNSGNLRHAKAERDVYLAQYQKAVQTAFREVSDALAQRGTIDQQLAAEQALVDSAADSLRLSDALYQHGSGSYLNVLTAQVTLYSARQALITTRLTRATNMVTLYQTLGGGLDGPAKP